MREEENRKSGFLAFWTTLPGILTGLAALITSVVGAVTLFKTQGGGNEKSATPGSSSVTIDVSQGPKASSGRLSLRRGDSADLEGGQVGQPPNADLTFGLETTPTLHYTGTSSFAPVDAQPTKSDCEAALRGRSDVTELVSEVQRRWVCVSTTEGNVAVVRTLSPPGVGNAKLVLGYTVWR